MLGKIRSLGVKFSPIETKERNKLLSYLEKLTGGLSKDYHDFLLHYGSNVRFDNMVSFRSIEPSPWADDKGLDDIEYFYGLSNTIVGYNIFEAIYTYKNDLKMKFIPIGFSSGGNQICICNKGRREGTIWFWDHNVDPIFDEEKIISGLTLVANDFNNFIDSLIIDDDTSTSKAMGGYLDF